MLNIGISDRADVLFKTDYRSCQTTGCQYQLDLASESPLLEHANTLSINRPPVARDIQSLNRKAYRGPAGARDSSWATLKVPHAPFGKTGSPNVNDLISKQ
jgi:hypothetical protein